MNITPFMYEDKAVRVLMDDSGEPWWVAKDVCDVLNIENCRDAVGRLDGDEKNTVGISDGIHRGNPNVNVINEPGLYTLIIRSNKPEAKRFKRWITHEVLPSIRKTGSYSAPLAGVDALVRDSLSGVRPSQRIRMMDLANRMRDMDEGEWRRMNDSLRFLCMAVNPKTTAAGSPDAVDHFIAERCVVGPDAWATKAAMYEAFETYCMEQGHACLTYEYFFRMLYEKVKSVRRNRPKRNQRRVQALEGIGLKP